MSADHMIDQNLYHMEARPTVYHFEKLEWFHYSNVDTGEPNKVFSMYWEGKVYALNEITLSIEIETALLYESGIISYYIKMLHSKSSRFWEHVRPGDSAN